MLLPLQGIKVLDLSRLLPGPFCSMILADFGAEVWKVEDTDLGDYMREIPGLDASYRILNRNKRSISLNLKTEEGQQVFYRLVREADIVLEQFRPGVAGRLGISYEDLRQINSRLIYCSLTGYGQTGPRAKQAGHDLNYIALAGLLGLCGGPEGPPALPAVQIADIAGGGLWSAVAILLAILARQNTGAGQYIDVSMLDGTISLLALAGAQFFAGGNAPHRGESTLSGSFACYSVYETADGMYLTLGALEEKFWAEFCRRVNHPEWTAEQFAPEPRRGELRSEVAALFRDKTRLEWLEFFQNADICLAPVYSLDEMAGDPHVQARQILQKVKMTDGGPGWQLGMPVKLSQTPGTIRSSAPEWGEHTEELLHYLGYDLKEIKLLKQKGIIR